MIPKGNQKNLNPRIDSFGPDLNLFGPNLNPFGPNLNLLRESLPAVCADTWDRARFPARVV
jgi:hypothetical protein